VKTRNSIRKKYRVFKIIKLEEDIALKRYFVELLKQIVKNTGEKSDLKLGENETCFLRRRAKTQAKIIKHAI